ncbi:unnamed protein product [Cuscuta europaea]|uniref:Ubiquitin-like protease family profile domain-containing protein n=1 Tax=Cuscuta europaea TaxID=41803 RepID=A0A9P0YJS6_CUSEU|nr:unnamed protein product [Cuscuta europaea]
MEGGTAATASEAAKSTRNDPAMLNMTSHGSHGKDLFGKILNFRCRTFEGLQSSKGGPVFIIFLGVTINHAQKSKKRLNLKWVRVMCPKQTGGVECGYFVMKYMKDIVSDVNRLKQNFSTVKEYTEDDILQVREEWALYAATLIKNVQADPTKA